MNHPLPAQADVAEWTEHLEQLSARAEIMLKARNSSVNDHAALALAAFRVLWSAWSPELILSSVKASQLVGTAVISGRPIAGQLLELESHMASWGEASDQMQPEPLDLMPVQMMVPPGTYPPPQERKPRKPRRVRELEQDLEPVLEQEDLEPLDLELEDDPAPELPPMWEQPEPLQHLDHPAAEPEPDDDEPHPPWLPTEPKPAPEPEIIGATELAAHFSKSLSWVNTLMNRRAILQEGIHYRARLPGESKGYKYFRDATFAAIAETRQRAPRRERALEKMAEQVLSELVG